MSLDPHAVRVANEKLWAQFPELKGRSLTAGSGDAGYRDAWNAFYREAHNAEPPAPLIGPVQVQTPPSSEVVEPCSLPTKHGLPKELFDPTGYVVSPLQQQYFDSMDALSRKYPKINQRLNDAVQDEFYNGWFGDIHSAASVDREKIESVLSRLYARAGLTEAEFKTLHYGRNFYQTDVPTLEAVQSRPWKEAGSKNFHTIRTDGTMSKEIGDVVEKYVNTKTGEEFVFVNEYGVNSVVLIDGINDGTYNFGVKQKSQEHMILDVYPWILWGTSADDPTTFEQRLEMWDASSPI